MQAYKSFGTRIKIVKRKLDEVIPTLASPIPSPDINAPSPERDADLQLPEENNSPLGVVSTDLFMPEEGNFQYISIFHTYRISSADLVSMALPATWMAASCRSI